VHRDALQVGAVGHHQIGVELHAALAESAEHADDVAAIEQLHARRPSYP